MRGIGKLFCCGIYFDIFQLLHYHLESPNWHHAGKNKLLLCLPCRMHFKRYGQMKALSEEEKREPPAFIFKAAFENLDDSIQYSGRMRTRRSSTPVFANTNTLRSRLVQEGMIYIYNLGLR